MSTIQPSLLGDCSIIIDAHRITPAAPRLFALVLLLTLERDRRLSRRELQDYLFADRKDRTLASHSLRQLLYKLRCMGPALDEHAAGVRLSAVDVADFLQPLRNVTVSSCLTFTRFSISFLPSYAPHLPGPYLEWLDRIRDKADHHIRSLLLTALAGFRQSQASRASLHVTSLLREIDPLNEEVLSARAEALTLLGRRSEALSLLSAHETRYGRESVPTSALRPLRARIERFAASRRAGPLRGRESTLSLLHSEWGKLDGSGARQFALVGHAGIGKTRLADAFCSQLSLLGAATLRYTCDTQSRTQPLSLFSGILPALRGMRGSLGAAPHYKTALSRLCPPNGGMKDSHTEGISLQALRSEVQAAVIDLIEAVSSERSMLLVVDDAHLLDDASCSILRALVDTPNTANLCTIACLRPSHSPLSLLAPLTRNHLHILEPLPSDASRELLLDLLAGTVFDTVHFEWCLTHAAGNPYYLHALALHTTPSSTRLPFDIRSLASTSYASLRHSTRGVLEACLLLGRFATIERVFSIASVDESAMLVALRELEDGDLVHFVDGILCGPHALLHDCIRELIPSAVAAFIHRRIATMLEAECVAEEYTSSLAWASARSWLATGDPHAATRLMRRCASHAAALGEPVVASQLLLQVVDAQLPPALEADLRDDLIRYAQAGGSQGVAASALRERYRLAHDLAEGPDALLALELRIVEADLLNGGRLVDAIEPLDAILTNSAADCSVRVQAAVRLLVIADQELDPELAERAHSWLHVLPQHRSETESCFLRAALVFHTSFGDVNTALSLAKRLEASFPQPSVVEESIRARNFAAFAFYRLRALDDAVSLCDASYDFMKSRGVLNHALYSASLRTEIALTSGNFALASEWLAKAEQAAGGIEPHQLSPNSGLYSNAGILAMMEGRFEDAERFVFAPEKDYSILAAARYRAVSCAISVRLRQRRATNDITDPEIAALELLYLKGRNLGGQDIVVEALWCALVLRGATKEASRMLSEYLKLHRREPGEPDWSLMHATAADDAWLVT